MMHFPRCVSWSFHCLVTCVPLFGTEEAFSHLISERINKRMKQVLSNNFEFQFPLFFCISITYYCLSNLTFPRLVKISLTSYVYYKTNLLLLVTHQWLHHALDPCCLHNEWQTSYSDTPIQHWTAFPMPFPTTPYYLVLLLFNCWPCYIMTLCILVSFHFVNPSFLFHSLYHSSNSRIYDVFPLVFSLFTPFFNVLSWNTIFYIW